MFSIFVYLFSATVSFWAAAHFRKAWKKTNSLNYWEFFMFFIFLGTGFVLYAISSGIIAEIGNFILLFSFAFVLRAFVRFQQIKSVSPNFISIMVIILSFIKLIIGIIVPSQPVTQGTLVYWHYNMIDATAFSICIILFTLAMALTFLSNLANIKKNKLPIFFLGTAFFLGGIGGSLVVFANSFWPLLASYLLIFSVFVFLILFILYPKKDSA